jgi:hypothetical protein
MCALRVAVQRRQAPNSRMECIEVVGYRQIMHIVWANGSAESRDAGMKDFTAA